MKIFITFLGILVMCVSSMIYQCDSNRYVQDMRMMKFIADEAACQAALHIDEEAYAEGKFCFEYEEAEDAIKAYLLDSEKLLNANILGHIQYDISYEDDYFGYGKDNSELNPRVELNIFANTEDMFSLAIFMKNKLKSNSKYEFKIFS